MKEQDGEVIRYIDGYAWGISPQGKTVCLGAEQITKEMIKSNKKSDSLIIDSVIKLERKLLKVENQKDNKEHSKQVAEKRFRHRRAIELGVARKPRTRKVKSEAKSKR